MAGFYKPLFCLACIYDHKNADGETEFSTVDIVHVTWDRREAHSKWNELASNRDGTTVDKVLADESGHLYSYRYVITVVDGSNLVESK